MAVWRIAPGTTTQNPVTVRGRAYSASVGGYADVPDFDAEIIVATDHNRGWFVLAKNVLQTSQRPVGALKGTRVFDSTVGAEVVSDGAGKWYHHATGVAV
ncbi:MAG: hypothetical protein C3F11_17305 [Methylocystaceae bacterium]|nr:MAG: hypothetical protein C3F11_17305 [Methylocystaceae bacterium]